MIRLWDTARLLGIPQKLCMKDVIDICDGYRIYRWISVASCLFWQAPWRSIMCRVRIHDSCTIRLPYAAIPAEHAHTCPTFPNISPIFTDSVHQCIWGTTDPDYLVILQHPRTARIYSSSHLAAWPPCSWFNLIQCVQSAPNKASHRTRPHPPHDTSNQHSSATC